MGLLQQGKRAQAIVRLFESLTASECRGRKQARHQAASLFCPWCAADVPYDRTTGRHHLGDLSEIDAGMAEQLRTWGTVPESTECRAGHLRSMGDGAAGKPPERRDRPRLI